MLLLDTCIIYEWMMGALKNKLLLEKITAEGAYISALSVWEMAIKSSVGKLPIPSADISGELTAQGFKLLNITPTHAQAVLSLPMHHKDPFDRLLIAQAIQENFVVVTYDRVFAAYIESLWLL